VGRRTGMPRTREGRGQADLRRGEAGTSLQHKTKSYIRQMAEPRISDDRALKVAGVYPGRPAASRKELHLLAYRNIRENR
jgi:hypothetical protein